MNIQSMPISALKVTPLLAALLTALALAGCGSDTTASKAGSDTSQADSTASQRDSQGQATADSIARKPCEYMARADAEAAVGLPLPKTIENIPLGTCDYHTPEFYGASLTVGDWGYLRGVATSGDAKHQPTAIPGVGDDALYMERPSMLYVRKGDSGFMVSLSGPSIDGLPDHGLEREKTLALKILSNF